VQPDHRGWVRFPITISPSVHLETAMQTEAPAELFRRVLSESVTVSVDGVYGNLVPDEPVKDTRAVGCVTIRMPDFCADTFAHNLAALWQLD